MKLLAIETATEACSAALLHDENVLVISELAPRQHNELILGMCEKVLAQAECSLSQLDAIAFGRGPGAFTGVRLAAGVTQGIALAQDLPVIPVSSLSALAQAAYIEKNTSQVWVCIDARMKEVYYALYQLNNFAENKTGNTNVPIMQLVEQEHVSKPEDIKIELQSDCYGVGNGWQPYAQILQQICGQEVEFDADALPQAEYVARLGEYYFQQGHSVSAAQALPVYLRNNVAQKPKAKIITSA